MSKYPPLAKPEFTTASPVSHRRDGNQSAAQQQAGMARSFASQHFGGPLALAQQRVTKSVPSVGGGPALAAKSEEPPPFGEVRDFDTTTHLPLETKKSLLIVDPLRPGYTTAYARNSVQPVTARASAGGLDVVDIKKNHEAVHSRVTGAQRDPLTKPDGLQEQDGWMDWENYQSVINQWVDAHPESLPADFNPNEFSNQYWVGYGFGQGSGGVHEGRLTGELDNSDYPSQVFALGRWRHHRFADQAKTDPTYTGGSGSWNAYQVLHGPENKYAIVYQITSESNAPRGTSGVPWDCPIATSHASSPKDEWIDGLNGYKIFIMSNAWNTASPVTLPCRCAVDEVGYFLGAAPWSQVKASLGKVQFHGGA